MARAIDPAMLAMMQADWRAAGAGMRTRVVQQWAERLGVSVAALYRALPRQRTHESSRKIEGIEDAARVVAAIKCRPPEHRGRLTTEQALRLAVENGSLEPRFGEVHPSTFDRVIRETGDLRQRRRVCRFQAERPNELHHVDASTSSCFYIAKRLPDGEYVLKLHRGTKDYKNKPIPVDGLRPWVYGLTDDHSGVHVARYVAACGESAGDNLDFLAWAWSRNECKEFFGLPEKIKGDKGPMMSSEGAVDFFGRLGVEIDPSVPLSKEAHGKIERPWRTQWQRFELPFFVESNWKSFEITLSELNRQFFIYQQELNGREHRFERGASRMDAWREISRYGGAVELPEDAIRTVVRRWKRKVDQAGVLSLEGVLYEVKGLHDAWVFVYQGVFEQAMVVVDCVTGQKYEVEDFRPNKIGEFTAAPHSPYQKAAKEAVQLDGMHNSLYTQAVAVDAKLKRLPTRTKEVRALENPLNVDVYPDVAAALRDLQAMSGLILTGASRAEVARLIEEAGCSRRFVAELAADIEHERVREAL
ncbi:DDE-type integrase/transposase/recombinase [Chrysiogenes arsenatis]|uniref:DDE-type integrase/transposase/recombinase n=1 Tax=Chrysiogenes arsenatis TaxID=309797 RepID=UPI00042942FB|nr:DDE-type integrase/transposase/recombinase [Chrysiogenes arsenatis]